MHQRRRLERLARFFMRKSGRSQLPQLLIHQRQQRLRRLRIALLNLRQDAGHVGHGYEDSQSAAEVPENPNDWSCGSPQPVSERVSKYVGMMPGFLATFRHRRSGWPNSRKTYRVLGTANAPQQTVEYLGRTRDVHYISIVDGIVLGKWLHCAPARLASDGPSRHRPLAGYSC